MIPKEHHILELAFNSLDKRKQEFISRLSAFRNPMDYDAISIFNDFGNEEKFNEVLIELVDRGMLFRDEKSNKFDLHPIVRRYCYDRLKNKESIHLVLTDYFAYIPAPEKIESVEDLAPVIELYHHTVGAGRYDEAYDLAYGRLIPQPLFFKFGAYQTIIELLRDLFPDGEDKLPKLKKETAQAWTLSSLASSFLLTGQPRNAVNTFQIAVNLADKLEEKRNVAIGLDSLACGQIEIGELDNAESNLRRSIEISREVKNKHWEASGHHELSRLLTYQGKSNESEQEASVAMNLLDESATQERGTIFAYRSIRSLLMSNAEEALKSAIKARELAEIDYTERDVIQVEYLLGAAYLMKGNIVEAEKHLNDALIRDRKINMVDLEPDILLEFAKLRFKTNHKKEALKFAVEALQIADRCEYRLKQADIHNFLAEFYLDAGDLEKAREHGEIAKERAECGYMPALEKAEKMLIEIGRG